jgi:hypothetical protein
MQEGRLRKGDAVESGEKAEEKEKNDNGERG